MTHTPPMRIPFGRGTTAYWSLKPEGKLIVFVHGFKGSAVATWVDFPGQLMLQREASGYDMVFFGYDSVTQTAGESADQFHDFINNLLFKSAAIANRSLDEYDATLRRAADFGFVKVVFVAHSLGACVIRQAMLNQLNGGRKPWPSAMKLILFAPAHLGAILFRLVLASSLGISRAVAALTGATYFAPVLADLKENSSFLKELLSETRRHCPTEAHLRATKTFWAPKDKVVINGQFANDFAPVSRIEGSTHMSVCKPIGYHRIVRELIEEMGS